MGAADASEESFCAGSGGLTAVAPAASPEWCRELLSSLSGDQKLTRRLKRKYEEIHHVGPVSEQGCSAVLFCAYSSRGGMAWRGVGWL